MATSSNSTNQEVNFTIIGILFCNYKPHIRVNIVGESVCYISRDLALASKVRPWAYTQGRAIRIVELDVDSKKRPNMLFLTIYA